MWAYDNSGNIENRRTFAYTTGEVDLFAYEDFVDYQYTNSNWGDLLTHYGDKVFSYDAIGNLLSDGSRTYTWKHGRQLATLSDGTTTWTYTYNSDGLRTKRTDGTKTYSYTYADGQLSYMIANGTDVFIAYDGLGQPLSISYNGPTYFYVTNLQGDVVALLNSSGTAVVEYTYDAWGNILSCTGSMASTLGALNPLRYRGYVYDNETGLYYLQSRYYDPEGGRFINADGFISTGKGLLGYNMYAYCNNNPVACIDSSGKSPLVILGVLAAFVVLGGVLGYFYDEELGATQEAPDFSAPPQSLAPNHMVPDTEAALEDDALLQAEDNDLTVGERVKNAAIGASLGLLAGGAVVATGGAALCVAGYANTTIAFLGMTGSQTFALGAVVYNVFGMVVAPFFGIEMETIEYEP